MRFAILGFLSRGPLSGYDLKKRFVSSELVPWSGNNNQVYTGLLALEREGLVTGTVVHRDDGPTRKTYALTSAGREALREWLRSEPELPHLRHAFLLRLQWADQLNDDELSAVLTGYEEQVRIKVLTLKEQARRDAPAPATSLRDGELRRMAAERWISIYESEQLWVHELRSTIAPGVTSG
jgi:DNA-binding PadR family transcriptional regulator